VLCELFPELRTLSSDLIRRKAKLMKPLLYLYPVFIDFLFDIFQEKRNFKIEKFQFHKMDDIGECGRLSFIFSSTSFEIAEKEVVVFIQALLKIIHMPEYEIKRAEFQVLLQYDNFENYGSYINLDERIELEKFRKLHKDSWIFETIPCLNTSGIRLYIRLCGFFLEIFNNSKSVWKLRAMDSEIEIVKKMKECIDCRAKLLSETDHSNIQQSFAESTQKFRDLQTRHENEEFNMKFHCFALENQVNLIKNGFPDLIWKYWEHVENAFAEFMKDDNGASPENTADLLHLYNEGKNLYSELQDLRLYSSSERDDFISSLDNDLDVLLDTFNLQEEMIAKNSS